MDNVLNNNTVLLELSKTILFDPQKNDYIV